MAWLRINLIFYCNLYAVPHLVVSIAFITVYPIIWSNYGSSDLCCLHSQSSFISLPLPVTPKTLNISYLNFLNLIVADKWQSLSLYAYAVCAALCLLQFNVPWPNNFTSALAIGRIVELNTLNTTRCTFFAHLKNEHKIKLNIKSNRV